MNDRHGACLDDGPLHVWHELDEQALRSWAAQYVGWATNEMGDPDDLSWTLDGALPLSIFDALQTDWSQYYRDEIRSNPCYDEEFATLSYHTPIVISVEGGEPIVWDGWHRIACAIERGDHTISAIVGRERRP